VDASLASGVVVCRGGPLEVEGSGPKERVPKRGSQREGPQERVSKRGSLREPWIPVPPPRDRRHGHGLVVRDVPYGPPSRADDELGSREGVHALRRAVSSLNRRRKPRRSLLGARPRRRSVLPPGIEVGPIAGERETVVARTPAETGHLEVRGPSGPASQEATCQPTILHLVVSTNTDVGHLFGGVGWRPVRDSAGVRTERPGERCQRHVGTRRLLSSPLGDARRPGSRLPP